MTFREFTGKNVEEAIRSAMKEFSAELTDLDIEILSQGSRGILGVGGEEARILAAQKSAVAAAETVRDATPDHAEPPRSTVPPREPREAASPPPESEGRANQRTGCRARPHRCRTATRAWRTWAWPRRPLGPRCARWPP